MFNYKIDYEYYVNKRKEDEVRVVGADVLECPLGADFSILPIDEQDAIIDDISHFYQSRGIEFLVERQNKWEDHMSAVFNINPENLINDEYISFSNLGNKFLMSHFTNFWKAKAKGGQSPKEVFENKEYLSDIIRKIVVGGYFPSKEKILKALQRYRGNKQVSGFMPCVAKSIYHKHCEEGSRVFDFCAGYGGRLFGAVACDKVKSYTCSEINFETYSNLHDLYRTLRLHGETNKNINIFNQDSILSMSQFSDKSFDFCFTSPPYFNAEIYSDEDSQSCNKYKNYSEWFNNFLIKSIRESMRISKKTAINIANVGGYTIADDLEKWLKSENMSYIIDRIRMPQYGGNYRYEPIFVF
jgi:16S rRNA G966 N2-methylase RsmD